MSKIFSFPGFGARSQDGKPVSSSRTGVGEDILSRLDKLRQIESAVKKGPMGGLSPGNVRDFSDALRTGRNDDALRIIEAAQVIASGAFSFNSEVRNQRTFLRRGAFRYQPGRKKRRTELVLVQNKLPIASNATQSSTHIKLTTSCELASHTKRSFQTLAGELELGAFESADLSAFSEIMLVMFAGTAALRNGDGALLTQATTEAHHCTVINIQTGPLNSGLLSLHNAGEEPVSLLWIGAKGGRPSTKLAIDVSEPIRFGGIQQEKGLVTGLNRDPYGPDAPHSHAESNGAFARYKLNWASVSEPSSALPTLLTNSDLPRADEARLAAHQSLEAIVVLRGGLWARGIERPLNDEGEVTEKVVVPSSVEQMFAPDADSIEEELFTASAGAIAMDVFLLDSELGHDVVLLKDVPSLALHKIFNCPKGSALKPDARGCQDVVLLNSISARVTNK